MTNPGPIKTVAVAGAGTMGLGIAQVCAMAGYKTLLYDLDPEILSNAIETIDGNLQKGVEKEKINQEIRESSLKAISTTTDLQKVKADLIIEAIVENLKIKQELLSGLEKINNKDTIFASNTSSIPITSIATGLIRPENFIGLHFFNPVHLMKLVEIISGKATAENVVKKSITFVDDIGKSAALVNDSPGFIVNRVARHFYLESFKILEEKVASFEAIDRLCEASGFKMGPFRLVDLIGIDVNYAVTSSMYESFNHEPRFRPNRIQKQMIEAGFLGRKSGKGFYEH